MDADLIRSAQQFHIRRRKKSVWKKLVSVLACVVVFCTTYALILPAITMERETVCGLQEHQHSESCYTQKAVVRLTCNAQSIGVHTHTNDCGDCGYADFVIHTHDDACYDSEKNLICPLPVVEEHTHGEDCYRATLVQTGQHTHSEQCYGLVQGELVCGLLESDGHTHGDSCYSQNRTLICALPESDGHRHGEDCLNEAGEPVCGQEESDGHHHEAQCWAVETVLTCQQAETEAHHHTDECYSWEEAPVCGMEEGPIYVQGEPELICEKQELQAHIHTAQCFDSKGNRICGQTEILSHVHSERCFDTLTESVLTCQLEEHSHTQTCYGDGDWSPNMMQESEGESMNCVMLLADDLDEDGILLAAADTTTGGIDFGQYITSASIYRLENGNWVVPETFRDGDTVKVDISYRLPANIISSSNRTAYYQLPSGVLPNEDLTGSVYQSDKAVGVFHISTDGLILIEYNEAFATGEAFTGSIEFRGTVSASAAGENGEVEFAGEGGKIIVEAIPEAEQTDIAISKTGTLSDTPNQIDYTVTVTTENGTGNDAVTLDDWLGSNGSYVCNGDDIVVVVKKTAADGTETTVSDVTVQRDAASNHFSLSGLSALEAGESYVITYSAIAEPNADGSCKLSNSAFSGGKGAWNEITVSNARVGKSGSYNDKTGIIDWTIHISNCAGFTLSDSIRASDDQPVNLPDTVTLKDANGTESTVSMEYCFPDDGFYTVTYQTAAPEAENTVTVTNTAEVEKDNTKFSSEAAVVVSKRSWGINKDWASESVVDGQMQYLWNVQVTIPAGELEEFTYTDTIQDSDGAAYHYAIASQLQAAIEANLRFELASETLTYSNDKILFSVAYYDAGGSAVAADDSETHVHSFTITVTPKEGVTIRDAYRLVLNQYPTIADFSEMTAGDTRVFGNTGAVQDLTDSASHSYTKPHPLVKAAGVLQQGYMTYTDGTLTVDYDEGILYYRLFLTTEASSNDEIIITDTLPEGAVYVEDSIAGYFYWDQYNQYSSNSYWVDGQEYTYDFANAQKPTVTQVTGTNNIEIKIAEGYNGDGKAHTLAIDYRVSIASDTYWSDLSHEQKTYVNTASWGQSAVSHEIIVNREVKKLNKTAEQLKDSNGNDTDVVEYRVDINPAGADLNPDSDKLKLVDTLTLPSGVEAYLDLENTQLYPYAAFVSGDRTTTIDAARYQVSYDAIHHELTIDLPDELACVLVYRYTVDRGAVGEPQLSNEVSLAGKWKSSSNGILMEASGSATVARGKLTIYKVDKADYSKRLPGAEFELDSWDASTQQWTPLPSTDVDGVYTTNESGALVFESDSENAALSQAVLYRLTETAAPDGYASSETPFYFVIMNDQTGNDTAKAATLKNMTNVFLQNEWNRYSGVKQDEVNFYPNDREVSGYIPNEYTQLNVKKVWVGDNGDALSNPPDSVQLQLIRHKGRISGYTVEVQVYNNANTRCTECEPAPVTVAAGSSLRIMIGDANGTYEVKYLDQDYVLSEKTGSNSTYWTCTVPTVGQNLIVQVYAPDEYLSNWLRVTFDDYTPAGYALDQDADVEVVTLCGENQWSYTWENLPTQDGSGNPYFYTVEESSVPDGYTVIYSNNGIQTGEIVVTNKKTKTTYTLPDAGGTGTLGCTLGGFTLMAASGLLLLAQKRRRRKET